MEERRKEVEYLTKEEFRVFERAFDEFKRQVEKMCAMHTGNFDVSRLAYQREIAAINKKLELLDEILQHMTILHKWLKWISHSVIVILPLLAMARSLGWL